MIRHSGLYLKRLKAVYETIPLLMELYVLYYGDDGALYIPTIMYDQDIKTLLGNSIISSTVEFRQTRQTLTPQGFLKPLSEPCF